MGRYDAKIDHHGRQPRREDQRQGARPVERDSYERYQQHRALKGVAGDGEGRLDRQAKRRQCYEEAGRDRGPVEARLRFVAASGQEKDEPDEG